MLGVVAFAGLAIALSLGDATRAKAADPKGEKLRPFMRQKLKHAQVLIEGLANEDFVLISDNARILRKLATDAQWRISPNLKYIKYSDEFAAITEELERRANEKDLNGATLSYIRLTINCVDCHRFVRDDHILDVRRQ
jgi:hypothetical protein